MIAYHCSSDYGRDLENAEVDVCGGVGRMCMD